MKLFNFSRNFSQIKSKRQDSSQLKKNERININLLFKFIAGETTDKGQALLQIK